MKRNSVPVFIFLLVAAMLFGTAAAQEALLKAIPVTIKKDAAVHLKASDFTEKIGDVKVGETYYLLKEENNMYQIKLGDGTIGWIRHYNAEVPLVENDVRVTGRLLKEPNIRSEIIIELRMNVSATLLQDDGKWKKVRIADGREGWITNMRTVKYSIVYSQRGGWLLSGPSAGDSKVQWVDEGIPFLPQKRKDNWYYIMLENGAKGWMENPHLPAALVAKFDMKLSLNDDIRRQNGAEIKKGEQLEPLDYFKEKYMLRTQNGEVGFQARGSFIVFEPEIQTIVSVTNVFAEQDKGGKVLTQIPAMSNIPVMERDGDWIKVDAGGGNFGWVNLAQTVETKAADGWMYVGADGDLLADAAYDAEVIGNVKVGQKFEKESIYGKYYEVTMEDGREGWLRIHTVKPSPNDKSVMLRDATLISGRKSQEGQHQAVGTAEKWEEVVQLEREEDYVQIRTKDGKTGWVHQYNVRTEGQVSDGAVPVLYHLMWKMYEHNHTTGFFGEVLYFIVFLLYLSIPYIIVYFAGMGIGYIKFLPNLIVKLLGTVVIFFGAIIIVHNTNWTASYPPYQFYPNLTMAGHLIAGLVTIVNFWHLIYRHRCKFCHTMFTVEITDVQHLGTVHHTETTTYNDGSRSKNRWTTKNYLVTYHCVQCDKTWQMEETYSSGGHS